MFMFNPSTGKTKFNQRAPLGGELFGAGPPRAARSPARQHGVLANYGGVGEGDLADMYFEACLREHVEEHTDTDVPANSKASRPHSASPRAYDTGALSRPLSAALLTNTPHAGYAGGGELVLHCGKRGAARSPRPQHACSLPALSPSAATTASPVHPVSPSVASTGRTGRSPRATYPPDALLTLHSSTGVLSSLSPTSTGPTPPSPYRQSACGEPTAMEVSPARSHRPRPPGFRANGSSPVARRAAAAAAAAAPPDAPPDRHAAHVSHFLRREAALRVSIDEDFCTQLQDHKANLNRMLSADQNFLAEVPLLTDEENEAREWLADMENRSFLYLKRIYKQEMILLFELVRSAQISDAWTQIYTAMYPEVCVLAADEGEARKELVAAESREANRLAVRLNKLTALLLGWGERVGDGGDVNQHYEFDAPWVAAS